MSVIIPYDVLHRWLNREPGVVHGDILDNIDNLIKMAAMRDDLMKTVQHMESTVRNLQTSLSILRTDLVEYKSRECSAYGCRERK